MLGRVRRRIIPVRAESKTLAPRPGCLDLESPSRRSGGVLCLLRAPTASSRARIGSRLKLVTQRSVVTAFQAAAPPLALTSFDQMLQTSGCLDRRFAAFSAAFITLHSQLIFPLTRNRQMRELVFDACSHGGCKARRLSPLYQSSISMTENPIIQGSATVRSVWIAVSRWFLQTMLKIGHSRRRIESAKVIVRGNLKVAATAREITDCQRRLQARFDNR